MAPMRRMQRSKLRCRFRRHRRSANMNCARTHARQNGCSPTRAGVVNRRVVHQAGERQCPPPLPLHAANAPPSPRLATRSPRFLRRAAAHDQPMPRPLHALRDPRANSSQAHDALQTSERSSCFSSLCAQRVSDLTIQRTLYSGTRPYAKAKTRDQGCGALGILLRRLSPFFTELQRRGQLYRLAHVRYSGYRMK